MGVIQKIYYGVPGTGKSYEVEQYLKDNKISDDQIFRVTFHPEYTYSDFIGYILPVSKKGEVSYAFQEGIFTQALKSSFQNQGRKIYLVIEEINRGNVSAIFGDIFQLLDRNDKNESRYKIRNSLISDRIIQIDNDDNNIYLPSNFNILATMNTSDQNLFTMDNAFKRRFSWRYVSTSPVITENGEVNKEYMKKFSIFWKIGKKELEWTEFYQKLNNYITDKKNGLGLREDKQIGQFFINYSYRTIESDFLIDFQEKLLQYLWSDVHLVAFNNRTLFSDSILNFSDLIREFSMGNKVFSDQFIDYYERL